MCSRVGHLHAKEAVLRQRLERLRDRDQGANHHRRRGLDVALVRALLAVGAGDLEAGLAPAAIGVVDLERVALEQGALLRRRRVLCVSHRKI